jgi:uncharacterized membrane protein YoaK (UPF0700 family)
MGVQLPRWVWIGAGSLACIAGMVNVVGYLGFEHQAVTHLTGTTSLFGAAVASGDTRAALHLLGVAVAFMTGAALSGMIIQDSTLRLGRRGRSWARCWRRWRAACRTRWPPPTAARWCAPRI